MGFESATHLEAHAWYAKKSFVTFDSTGMDGISQKEILIYLI